jgi:2-keto-3-deoxy-6-phosphogluconate aldolase
VSSRARRGHRVVEHPPPTEVGRAVGLGISVVKAFSASVLTPEWVSAVREPFPEVDIVAPGGVQVDNAASFLKAGALAVGVGCAATSFGLGQLVAETQRNTAT